VTIARVLIPSGTVALLVGFLLAIPFSSGWEVQNSIQALTLTDRPGLTWASDCNVYRNEDGALVGRQGLIGPQQVNPPTACATGTSSWQIDVDDRWTGKPSLQMESTPVRHTNFQGIQTDNNMAVESRTVTRLRDTYYMDYHVFMFDFRVKTVADARSVECHANLLFQQACTIDHETSANLGSTSTRATVGGEPFDGSSFVAFSIKPWQGARIAPENTIRFGQWAGIMQAIVFEAEAGICSPTSGLFASCPQGNLEVNSPGYAIGVLARNAAANMFTLQGQGAPSFQFGTASLDDSIPQIVLVELPYKLLAGADWTASLGGGYSSLVPIDYNVHYIVRMDVLLVTGWQPQLDYVDSNNNGVRDSGEFTFIDKNDNNLWDSTIDETVEGTPPSTSTASVESPPVQPESPPQTGSSLAELGPIPDFRSPSPCEFWNLSCFFNNAINFPSISSLFNLLTILALIVVLVFGASIFLGRRRGR